MKRNHFSTAGAAPLLFGAGALVVLAAPLAFVCTAAASPAAMLARAGDDVERGVVLARNGGDYRLALRDDGMLRRLRGRGVDDDPLHDVNDDRVGGGRRGGGADDGAGHDAGDDRGRGGQGADDGPSHDAGDDHGGSGHGGSGHGGGGHGGGDRGGDNGGRGGGGRGGGDNSGRGGGRDD